MSDMEFSCGTFKKSDLDITPKDDDDFYDLEEEHGCYYVKVDGQLYSFTPFTQYDSYGFGFTIPPQEDPIYAALWYNGGAGIHEVVAEIIKKHIDKERKNAAR